MIYVNWSYKTCVKTENFILILHNMSKLQQVFFWILYTVILGRLRRRWVDNTRMDLQEVGCGYMDWIGLA